MLDDHRHWAGCPYARRHPGRLFGGAPCSLCHKPVCGFRGSHGTRLSHTLATDDRFEHHEYCRDCHQVWHSIAS